MGKLISLSEWAKLNGITPETARQRASRGAFTTAIKIGRIWVIDAEEPLIDNRHKGLSKRWKKSVDNTSE